MNPFSTLSDRFQGSTGYQLWEKTLGEQCGVFHPEPPTDTGVESFKGLIIPANVAVPGYAGAKIDSNCSHIYRNVSDIKRDGHDFYYIIQQVAGIAVMDHCGTQSIMNPGDLLLLDSSKPSDFYFPGMSEQISVLVPRHKLEVASQNYHLHPNKKINSTSKTALIARAIISQFFQSAPNDNENEVLLETLTSLIRNSLSAPQSNQFTYSEKVQKLYFEKALRCIESNLSNFELTPDIIAAELGTSKRTLHRIFAKNGQSIGRYMLERRLDKCASEFETETNVQKVSSIAFAWGFNDVSHFSRAFKTRFGVSPRDYKHRGMKKKI
ncbi:Transcriptional activator FeaR [Pseudomonas sp. Bi70]|uniref:transcriptional regulator FeaR n=1 Tax=Pseudomonas sp. Bi70 TaxID=2821127 RepID=UPI001DD2C13B|nr:transcriptional regulator FeaR [Pseudomonas sp. Bi70]CAH0143706.1 Transcriptional activator FeaR [Pseudomonas sp. Bi70]